jgi:Rrf2 family nitric oxide-sensitive transcriptional repressor
MKLTTYTDYALRVLIYLCVHPNRLVQKSEIAEAFGVSKNHLAKVIQNLGRSGFVDVKRGRGGGIVLAEQPSKIKLGAVIDAFEPDFDIVECFDPETNTCRIAPVCGLTGVLREAELAFHGVLMNYTLADIVKPRGRGRYAQHLKLE